MKSEEYLLNQLTRHPSMTAQDMIKMAYQAVFGAEHLLLDEERAKKYFFEEYENNLSANEEVAEMISEHYCRVDLHAIRIKGIDPDHVFDAFVKTAKESCGNEIEFLELVESYERILIDNGKDEMADELKRFLPLYLKEGIRAIHHSDVYRESEKPAYRVIAVKYLNEMFH